MSIIVTQIRLTFDADDNAAVNAALKRTKTSPADLIHSGIYKRSVDLRHGTLSKVFSVELSFDEKTETFLLNSDKTLLPKPSVSMPQACGSEKMYSRPVVVGFGPAGMFAALILAENGFEPIVIERGGRMDERDESVSRFFKTGALDTSSNIQFGEGGAGAYSDGKLTTRINDRLCLLVSELLEKHGAPKETLCLAKPHIGTDVLKKIVVSVRKRIEELGGSVYFNTCLTDISFDNFKVNKVITSNGTIDTETVVLAIGHSARDTVRMLAGKGIDIVSKAFSVGFRIEHLRDDVNRSVYGKYIDKYDLPAAEYTLSTKRNGRGCYSFCMCPGGYVIAAASEEGGVVTNGMSYHSRNGVNSNSAICVSVGPDVFGTPFEG
ncbi:MAG: hypothetical protein IJS65_06205, partial [Clostridia bacterium]|nr:hypothetical protein [Clostridia bacterium]